MTAERITAVADLSQKLESTWSALAKRLGQIDNDQGIHLDFNTRTSNLSCLAEIDARITILLPILGALESLEESILVPRALVDGLIANLTKIDQQINSVNDVLNRIEKDGGYGNIDPTQLIVANKNGKISLNLNEQIIKLIHGDLEQILQQHISWVLLFRDPGAPRFDVMTGRLRGEVEEIRSIGVQAREALKQTTEIGDGAAHIKSEMEKIVEGARSKLEEVNCQVTETSQVQEQITQHEEQAKQGLAVTQETAQQAERLKASVDSYGEEFKRFQHGLDERNKTFEDGTREQNTLLESLGRMETRINDLNEQAEQMMEGATVAGLASEFGNRRDDLTSETRRAAMSFYVAIGLLACSVVPLALLLSPEYDPLIEAGAGTTAYRVDFLAQAVVRILIILPFAWLTKFTAARHARLFKLREHYSYKHSVAASVEGF